MENREDYNGLANNVSGLDQDTGKWEWEKGLGPGCILKVKSIGPADRFEVEGKGELLPRASGQWCHLLSWARLGEKISFWGKAKRLVIKVLRLRCLLEVEVKSLGFGEII